MHASKMKAKINKQEPIKMANRKAERRKHGRAARKVTFEFSNYRMRKYIQQITLLLKDSQKLILRN